MSTATETPARVTTCSSCGHMFTPEEGQIACGTCVTSGSCGMERCPNCGLEQARTPAFLQRLLGLFRSSAPAAEHAGDCSSTKTLAGLRAGEAAVVEKFLDPGNVRKFLSLGILPGTQITVVRHTPVVVLRVGYSEFAFDRNLASTVQVARPGAGK